MREVAALARVSLKTVSRVINSEPSVTATLRSRVQAAVENLDYRSNLHASCLRRADGKSGTIGLLLPDVGNAFSSTLHREIANVALEHGVLVFAGSWDEDEKRGLALIAAFTSHRVDGLIIVATSRDRSLLLGERSAGTAMVFVDRPPPRFDSDAVLTDDCGGVRAGVRHLIAHGHRRIGFLGGPASISTVRLRYHGYKEELEAHGLSLDRQLVRLDLRDSHSVESAALELTSRSTRATALFTSQNMITLSSYRAVRKRDLQRQVALVGFDDSLLPDCVAQAITVVAPDPVTLGRASAELLFRRIDGDHSPTVHRLLPTRLIARGSGEVSQDAGH